MDAKLPSLIGRQQMGAEDVGDLGRYTIFLRGHPFWNCVPPSPNHADVVEEGVGDGDGEPVIEDAQDVYFGPAVAVQQGPPHIGSAPVRDAGDDVHVSGAYSNASFLNHVHGGGAGADDHDVRLGDFAGLADVVIMFYWKRCRLLTGQFGDVGEDVVSATQ